jgi:outer membrane protein TolC
MALSLFAIISAARPSRSDDLPLGGRTGAQPLSFAQALARASAAPAAVLASVARVDAADARIDAVAAARLPSVSATASAGINFIDQPVAPGPPPVRVDSTGRVLQAGVTGRVLLYDFGRTSAQVGAARASRSQASHDLESVREAAVLQVAESYLGVLRDADLVSASTTALAQRTMQLDAIKQLVSHGLRGATDAARTELEVIAARIDLTAATTRELIDRADLAVSLGFDPDLPLAIEPVSEETFRIPPVGAANRAAVAANRPEVDVARARLAQAESRASASRAASYPVIALSGGASTSDTKILSGVGLSGLSNTAMATLGLSWNGIDPATWSAARAAGHDEAAARADLAGTILQAKLDVARAWLAVEVADAVSAQTERQLAVASLSVRSMRERYDAGDAGVLDLLDVLRAERAARTDRFEAMHGQRVAKLRLLVRLRGPHFADPR